MQMNYEGEQLCLYDLDIWCGKTYQVLSPAEIERAKIFAVSWRKSSELKNVPVQCLDLTPGHGDLLGQSYWELNSHWLGDVSMLNTGVSPNVAVVSSLSQILVASPPIKYYLSVRACLGILRRARERNKELPERLKRALEIQAGIRQPDGRATGLESYHINQRDEGINLNGLSGALMATLNQQMQTFVTQEAKQEVVAVEALCINDQGGERMDIIEEKTGTLLAQSRQPLVLATQQGGAEIGEGICPTITASAGMSGNNQPVLYENHGIDSRYTGPLDVSPTMSARYGTGVNNVPLVEKDTTLCIMGNAIDRQPHNGGNGLGISEDVAYTLTATDHHAIYTRQGYRMFRENEIASTECERQHKGPADLIYQDKVGALTAGDGKGPGNQYVDQDKCVIDPSSVSCYGPSQFANYSEGVSTLRAQGGDYGGGSENLVTVEDGRCYLLIRRLIPLECERLQGFPDGWTDLPNATDAARYKALGNSVAIPCVDFVIGSIAQELRSEEMQNE